MNNKQELPKSTDVLVVGAGPAGMTLAISLKQLGVDCVVIDQLPSPPDDTRAAFVQPRTLEYLRRLHVSDPMVDDGLKGRGFAMADREHDLIRVPYDTVDSPYPFLLIIGQWQTQRHLDQRFAELGGSVLRGVRLLNLAPEFPGSAATVVDSDGALRVINARFVAGCDGVWSRVRDQLGIGFPGSSPAQMFAVADVKLPGWPADRVEPAFTLSPHGMLIVSPLPGGDMARVVASAPPGTPAPTLQDVNDLIQTRGPSWMRNRKVEEVRSSATWHVHERVATQFQHGNTFLLGDAAHTHSPAGGQGMNTGIQDAANLAWKLHHALTGRAAEQVLDSYDAERRPVAHGLIAFTSQLMQLATVGDPHLAALRNQALFAAAGVPGVTDWLATKLSQLDIGYPNPRAGDSLAGTRVDPRIAQPQGLSWTLVLPSGSPIPDLPADITVTTTAEVGRSVAVRPDGIAADRDLVGHFFGDVLNIADNDAMARTPA